MMLFGRKRDSVKLARAKVCRAKYATGPGHEELELRVITEDGERLEVIIPVQLAPAIIGQMTDAYEAINPPLSRRTNFQAGWDGAGN